MHMRSVAAAAALSLLVLTACGDDSSGQANDPSRPRGVAASDAPRPIDGISAPDFDGGRAFSHIETQVAFGPRVAGTTGHAAQLEWMTGLLREHADTLITQTFTHASATGGQLRMTNLFARFRPDASERILLVAHWDTRSIADMEPDAARRSQPIPGANDGASGTALLLHLAELLDASTPPVGVDLLLVDGEDYLPGEMYLGAKHFASGVAASGYRPRYGILVDMIADADPVYPVEANSAALAPDVIRRVYALAHELGYGANFPLVEGGAIEDDHLPLNQAGIPTIDIIDFDFGRSAGQSLWHTHADDMSAVSVRGLEAVGTVLTELVYRGG